MRLALISGANPRTANDCACVRLSAGTWKLEYDGVHDTEFLITLVSKAERSADSIPFRVSNGFVLKLHQAAEATLQWKNRGNEKYVSVFAEKVA